MGTHQGHELARLAAGGHRNERSATPRGRKPGGKPRPIGAGIPGCVPAQITHGLVEARLVHHHSALFEDRSGHDGIELEGGLCLRDHQAAAVGGRRPPRGSRLGARACGAPAGRGSPPPNPRAHGTHPRSIARGKGPRSCEPGQTGRKAPEEAPGRARTRSRRGEGPEASVGPSAPSRRRGGRERDRDSSRARP